MVKVNESTHLGGFQEMTDLFSVEFALGLVKIVAIIGFIIFGIIVNVGGVPGMFK